MMAVRVFIIWIVGVLSSPCSVSINIFTGDEAVLASGNKDLDE
jgi:hypothetical protein